MYKRQDDGWTANYEIIPDKEKVIKDLRKASKEVEKVYLATDLDREGEDIAWHLKEALGKNKFENHRFFHQSKNRELYLHFLISPLNKGHFMGKGHAPDTFQMKNVIVNFA